MSEDDKKDSKIDKFELSSAMLLGLAAIGAAWASYQSDLWGGQSVEAYAEANKIATRAESAYNRAASEAERDIALDIQAKQSILVALNTKDDDDGTKAVNIAIAGYLYQEQLTEEAYKEMKLPPEYYRTATDDDPKSLSEAQLTETLDQMLGDDHWMAMVAPSEEMAEGADAEFKKGQNANQTGDKFGMSTIIYALCLFLTGTGLVVKNKVKWGFIGVGGLAFAAATAYMFTVPWAG